MREMMIYFSRDYVWMNSGSSICEMMMFVRSPRDVIMFVMEKW